MTIHTRVFWIAVLLVFFLSCSQQDKQKEAVTLSKPVVQVQENPPSEIEYFIPKNDDYCGVYLPDSYIEQIKSTRSHSRSIHSAGSGYYNLLSVHPEIIYSDLKWHDGFAIHKENGENFQFYEIDGSQKIRDENGFAYTQISKDYKDAYRIIDNFVLQTLFHSMIEDGNAIKSGFGIEIKGHRFRIILDDMFYPKTFDVLLFEDESKKSFAVNFTERNAKFYSLLDNPDDIEMLVGPEIEF